MDDLETKPSSGVDAPSAGSAPGESVESEGVDMWDRPLDDPYTVSNLVRKYTAQWGLPRMWNKASTAEEKEPNVRISDGANVK